MHQSLFDQRWLMVALLRFHEKLSQVPVKIFPIFADPIDSQSYQMNMIPVANCIAYVVLAWHC